MNREPDHRLRRRRDQDDGMVGLPLPRPGPKTVFAFSWWVVGLYVLFFAKGLTPSPESEQKYSELMQQAVFSNEAREMEEHVRSAMRHLDKVHVWGWRWREPYASLVPERMAELEMAQRNLEQALAERNALISEAKGAVGIWSTHGVEDVRDRFWKAYQSGKDFAQRMSWWDTAFVFMGRGSRDEEAALTLLRWVGQIMMNFTVGLLSALVSFGFSLVGMIWEYKTSLFGGLLFFTVAFSAAASMVAAFIGGMVASAVGGVYLIDKQVRNARLEGRAGDQRRYVRNREYHYD
ncbi:hypothetical protein AB1Y20_019943 [Prymnesium parvum]|uniref:Transmembrane 9 superfamily member n=1 Tax=Prymnesium parvum TaxID=97485 RepID=A0AB34JWM3_PRYPA